MQCGSEVFGKNFALGNYSITKSEISTITNITRHCGLICIKVFVKREVKTYFAFTLFHRRGVRKTVLW